MRELWRTRRGELGRDLLQGRQPGRRAGADHHQHSEQAAEAFACQALLGRKPKRPGSFSYASIRRGR